MSLKYSQIVLLEFDNNCIYQQSPILKASYLVLHVTCILLSQTLYEFATCILQPVLRIVLQTLKVQYLINKLLYAQSHGDN